MGQFDNVLVGKLKLDSDISSRFASTSSTKPEVSEDDKKRLLSAQLQGALNGSAKPTIACAVQNEAKSNPGSHVGAGFMA